MTKCKRCGIEFGTYRGSVSRKLCFHCDNDFHNWAFQAYFDPTLKPLTYQSITRQINWWIKYQGKRVIENPEIISVRTK